MNKLWEALTKKERDHMNESDCPTLASFKHNAEVQAEMRKHFPNNEPCWECKSIAIYLGLPV